MWVEREGNLSTVDEVVRGLAKTLTASIRNNPINIHYTDALKHVKGVAITTQTCIYVSWGWIAHPAVLLVLQAVFSTLVLAGPRRTRSSRERPRPLVWKSSPLALLFHGLDDRVRRDNRGLETVAQMDEAGKRIRVRLSRMDGEDRGWRLSAD